MFAKFLLVLVGCFLIVTDGKNAIETMKAGRKEMEKKVKLKTVDLLHSKKSLTSVSLQSWNRYDSAFTSGWYLNAAWYSDAECTEKKNYAIEVFETYCMRGSAVSNEGVTYSSAQKALNRDGSEETIVFFENGNCEGTPSIQANTQRRTFPTLNTCFFDETDESGLDVYMKVGLGRTALGNPFDDIAAKQVLHAGTESCDSASVQSMIYYKTNSCMGSGTDASYTFEVDPNDGVVIKYFVQCSDCSCEPVGKIPMGKFCGNSIDDINDLFYYYDGDDDGDEDDALFDDQQFFNLEINDDFSEYWSYDLPQKCLWNTGCAGGQCEAGTVCNEFRWWSQCAEDPAVDYADECISTRNGPGRTAHWGCTEDADCCNEDARCDKATKYCNLPCEQVDAPPDGPLAGAFFADTLLDSKGTGVARQIVVPIVISVVVAGILLALGVYYYVNRSVKGRGVPSSQEEGLGMVTIVVDAEAPTAE